jgi:putative membrane protein
MRCLITLLANAAALAVATWLLNGITLRAGTTERRVGVMLAVALIFGVVNTVVKPVFRLVSAPIILITFGVFLLVINALLLMLTSWVAGQFDLGWHVTGFWTAVGGSLIVSVVSWLLNTLLDERDHRRRR